MDTTNQMKPSTNLDINKSNDSVRSKTNVLLLILILIIVFLLGLIGFLVYQNTQLKKQITNIDIGTAPTPTTHLKTYRSANKKISFNYPSDWITVTSPQWAREDVSSVDQISIQSPDGLVTVLWLSEISGLGGGCDPSILLNGDATKGPCPLVTVVDKTPISGARGLFVVSGTITSDGITHRPWIVVQDGSAGALTSVKRSMGYDEFSLDDGKTNSIFSTAGIYVDGPKLNEKDAIAWFKQPSIQQAKQIFLSLAFN